MMDFGVIPDLLPPRVQIPVQIARKVSLDGCSKIHRI
jgi:hypothetical protein